MQVPCTVVEFHPEDILTKAAQGMRRAISQCLCLLMPFVLVLVGCCAMVMTPVNTKTTSRKRWFFQRLLYLAAANLVA